MNSNWLTGKTVVITGGSGGLGLALSQRLIHRWGCHVIATGRSPERLEAARSRNRGNAGRFLHLSGV